MKKLLIIGLDCATPQLVFEQFASELPNLRSLWQKGHKARLVSTIPPITVPAWTSMMTSKDPGQLGFYGFRNRAGYDYENLYFANAKYVKEKTVWNYLNRNRMATLVFGVPQTYPPKPLNGIMVGCFLTPDKNAEFTYPAEIKAELDQSADGDYIIDVKDFRTDNKDWLIEQIYLMADHRFKAFRHFYKKDEWPFAMMVEMGIDRIHHGFWRYFDQNHRLYEKGNKYENVIRDFYIYIDKEIGKILNELDGKTSVMVVSDHGAKSMVGAICVNEWLQKMGWLKLKNPPREQTKMKMDNIDWEHTRVWSEGGYYARMFFNVKGREPKGVIEKSEYEKFRDEVKSALEAIEDENGKNIGTKVYKPEEIYKAVNGIAPDLIVHFGNLDWRSAGTVGGGRIHIYENDTGPDDANHAQEGIFIWGIDPKRLAKKSDVFSIYDIAPTILKYFGIEIPQDMIGKSLIS